MRDLTLEETAYFLFTTRAFSSGVPTTLSGSPVLSVLESNNATPITAGVSVAVDRASVTGLNQATIVATAANGYEAGKSYAAYISTGTVGGVSVVGEVVAEFTVQASAAFTRLGAPIGASISADVLKSERNVRQTIESQRGHHTGCGAIFYVKKGGNDSNAGTYAAPFLTIQAALNACTANAHDTVVVLGVTGSSPSSFSEAITMSKAYVFLRGMGRDTKITTAGAASSTITISANGCEVSGLWVNNTGAGATNGIETASGSDFAWLHHLSIDGAATGVLVTAGTNSIIENNWINDCATAGINLAQGGAVGLHTSILHNHIDGSAIGVNFAGSDSTEAVARYNNIAGCTTGLIVAAGAVRVQVTDNRFAGNTTNWTDAGTNTNLQWNTLATSIAGAVSNVTLVDTLTTYTGNTPQTANVATLITTVGAAGAGLTDIMDRQTSTLTVVGSIGERIKNTSTVTTTGDQLAALL